ncbi:MAG TPA: GFA family protein [Burkholderiales bacterium]|nr:GFA family protein [Burkholderiales bacterium]
MKIDGACHCGNIRYEAEVDPGAVSICHCTDCQTLSGTAFRAVVPSLPGGFKLLGGQPKVYIKTAESGRRRAQGFCPECGTSIYASDVTDAKVYNIRLGTVRQRAELRPVRQIWFRSALGWAMQLDSVPKTATQ